MFRRLKNGGQVGWALMHHWTGCSILKCLRFRGYSERGITAKL